MMMTRDKYEGTPYYPGRGVQGGPFENPNRLPYGFQVDGKKYSTARMISVNRAEYVTVTQSRGFLSNPVGGLVWLAFGAQDYVFDRQSARWAFDYVDFHTQAVYSLAKEDVREAQEAWEKSAIERAPLIDRFADELYRKDPAQAARFLTEYCVNNANRVVDRWWQLGDELLVKYNKLWIYDAKTRKRNPMKYPDWWLRLLVEYNKLQPRSEEKK